MPNRLKNGASYHATFDPDVGASYIQITNEPIVRTSAFHNVNIDLDAEGRVVGIEVL